MHGHPGADVQVLVCSIVPHIPQVSLQDPPDQADHVPPAGHGDVGEATVDDAHVSGAAGGSVADAGNGPQIMLPFEAMAL